MSWVKNGSTPRVGVGRAMTHPTAWARDTVSERAATLGAQPISSAIAMIRARVCSDTPGRPLSA